MSKTRNGTFGKPKRKRHSGMRCSVRFCKNKTAEKAVSFFNYPSDVERRALWIEACETQRRVSLDPNHQTSARVCGDHFEKQMFLNIITKNRLVFNAVPTLFNDEILEQRRKLKKKTIYSELIEDSTDEHFSDVDFENTCSTESSLYILYDSPPSSMKISSEIQPSLSDNSSNALCMETYIKPEQGKINQLLNAVIVLGKKLTTYEGKENILKLCDKYLSPELFELVKLHMDVKIEEDKYNIHKCI